MRVQGGPFYHSRPPRWFSKIITCGHTFRAHLKAQCSDVLSPLLYWDLCVGRHIFVSTKLWPLRFPVVTYQQQNKPMRLLHSHMQLLFLICPWQKRTSSHLCLLRTMLYSMRSHCQTIGCRTTVCLAREQECDSGLNRRVTRDSMGMDGPRWAGTDGV